MDRDFNLFVQASILAFKLYTACSMPSLSKLVPVNISWGFCYVLHLSIEQTSSVFSVSALCALVLSFVLGNYVAVLTYISCYIYLSWLLGTMQVTGTVITGTWQAPDCAWCSMMGLLWACFIVWVSVVPMGTLYCPSVTWTFLPRDMTCCMFVCCSLFKFCK